MAEGKKYYWLKLDRHFFKRHDIQIVRAMTNGKDYILFYLMLLVESIDHEGMLRFSETIPYNEEMLAIITDINVDIVRSAVKIFSDLGLITILDDKTLYMKELEKMIGGESWSADRVRRFRERQKLIGVTSTLHDVTCNEDKDIEKEKDSEKEENTPPSGDIHTPPKDEPELPKPQKHKYGTYSNVMLTNYEYSRLQNDFSDDTELLINILSEYIHQNTKYKKPDHNLCLRGWVKDKLRDDRIKEAERQQREKRLNSDGVRLNKKPEAAATFDAEEHEKWSFQQTYGGCKQ